MDKYLAITLLAVLPGGVTAAASDVVLTDEPQMLVTANATPPNEEETAAGAGFVTTEVTPGPAGSKAWLDTPYSTTTVHAAVINNQQANSVSELLKYSPSTQMQADRKSVV